MDPLEGQARARQRLRREGPQGVLADVTPLQGRKTFDIDLWQAVARISDAATPARVVFSSINTNERAKIYVMTDVHIPLANVVVLIAELQSAIVIASAVSA